MLAITTKSQYGLTALLDLAERFGQGSVQIGDIVRRRNVPRTYLEQILNRLSKYGIVKGTRGIKGGYELIIRPEELSLLRIIESLEGTLSLSDEALCGSLREALERATQRAREALDITLAQVLERQNALERQPVFHI